MHQGFYPAIAMHSLSGRPISEPALAACSSGFVVHRLLLLLLLLDNCVACQLVQIQTPSSQGPQPHWQGGGRRAGYGCSQGSAGQAGASGSKGMLAAGNI